MAISLNRYKLVIVNIPLGLIAVLKKVIVTDNSIRVVAFIGTLHSIFRLL